MEQTTLTQSSGQRLTAPDLAGMQVTVTSRHDGSGKQGKVNYLNVDMTGTAVNMGGTTTQKAQFINTHVDMENMQVAHKVHHAEVTNSLIHLQKMASVNLADVVTVDARSSVHGGYVVDANDITPDDPCIVRGVSGLIESGGPVRAAEVGSSTHLNEVSTSVSTHVHMTFADFKNNDPNNNVFQAGDSKILVLMTEQFKGVDVSGNGLTIQLQVDNWVSLAHQTGADYIAIQMGGGTGQFHYEVDLSNFGRLLDSQFVLRDSHGNQMTGMWVTSTDVWTATGQEVSPHMLYFIIPEPATATLSLLALAALCARRRRKA
jgi:MYXO-CTERM domain-containing protein